MTTLEAVRGAADPAARVKLHTARGEPVAAVLAALTPQAAQLIVLGKRHAEAPRAQAGAIGSVALRIVYQAPTDVLVLS